MWAADGAIYKLQSCPSGYYVSPTASVDATNAATQECKPCGKVRWLWRDASGSDVRCDSREGHGRRRCGISLTCIADTRTHWHYAGRGVRGFIVCDVHAVRAGPLQGGGQHGGVRGMPQGHLPRDAGGDRARQLRRMLGQVLYQRRRGADAAGAHAFATATTTASWPTMLLTMRAWLVLAGADVRRDLRLCSRRW